jgi:murein DD-endopeptidase MepM/ murein hydrolase activator NlpD
LSSTAFPPFRKGGQGGFLDLSGNYTSLRKSHFTGSLIRNNIADARDFREWVFCPGMLFNAMDKWWGGRGRRRRPHEGLDLCLYRNQQGRVLRLAEGTLVPAMYDGEVVKIIDDFLGSSVIIDHALPDAAPFCTVYGHTVLQPGVEEGSRVREGDMIAAIAGTGRSGTGLLPHLHITIGLIPDKTSYDRMDWETIGSQDILTLLDPLDVIGGDYAVQDTDLPPCRGR